MLESRLLDQNFQGWFKEGGGSEKTLQPLCYPCNLSGVFWCGSVLGSIFQAIIYISSEHNVSRNNKNIFNRFELIWPCYDLESTLQWPWDNSHMKPTINPFHHVYLRWVPIIGSAGPIIYFQPFWADLTLLWPRWPYHDLGITPLWKPPQTHVTMALVSTYLYDTFLYFDDLRWPCTGSYNLHGGDAHAWPDVYILNFLRQIRRFMPFLHLYKCCKLVFSLLRGLRTLCFLREDVSDCGWWYFCILWSVTWHTIVTLCEFLAIHR